VTNDYFATQEAVDIYYKDSFFMSYFMDKKMGLFERPEGGDRIRIPLEYDLPAGGFFTKGSALNSDAKTIVNAAFFNWKHVYGNGSIHMVDEIKNAGELAKVKLILQQAKGAQKKARRIIAENIYNSAVDGAEEITGLGAATGTDQDTAYGGLAQNDVISTDLTEPWTGRTTTTAEAVSLDVIRTMRSTAKISDGAQGKPDVGLTTETLFNVISSRLQVQQRFTSDTDTVKAGFVNLWFEGMLLAVDDFVASGNIYALNKAHIGFAIHTEGFFQRFPWVSLIVANQPSKSMKIFWHGNLINDNRKAHIRHSGLTA
jgi:hypothetical protein